MQRPFEFEAPVAGVQDDFLDEVLKGLSRRQKELPSRFFYDARGSDLFERITGLDEYYPTRTELGLLEAHGREIGGAVPAHAAVVEFGSGSSRKTELLLKALDRPSAYIPIEISAAALYPAAQRISTEFPELSVHPVLGGFHDLDTIKLPPDGNFFLGFFPGSTIGNLTHGEAIRFLRAARRLLGPRAAFLIGADLKKPLGILLPAYDDADGVTAAFNLNILARVNRELDGTFDLDAFEHQAIYNAPEGRVEMHLRSTRAQSASVAGRMFTFLKGETIHTENSHKYSIQGFEALAREGGWAPVSHWLDDDGLFSLHLLV